ncbi:MAG: hypothetical protein ACRCXM_08980 [Beijerinckiaceae bacterium]
MADLAFGAFKLKFGAHQLVFGGIVVPAGSPGGGGTVAKVPDPIRPDRRKQVRDTLARQFSRAQGVDKPEIAAKSPAPETPRKTSHPVMPEIPVVTTGDGLAIIREIEAKVQASIEAAALIEAEAMALQLALIAQDEADVEMLLLMM